MPLRGKLLVAKDVIWIKPHRGYSIEDVMANTPYENLPELYNRECDNFLSSLTQLIKKRRVFRVFRNILWLK